jgi:hypothetical protein
MPGQENPNNNQVVVDEIIKPSVGKATITNQSGTAITYYIDMNESSENWDENLLKEFSLGNNQQKTIDIPVTFCLLNGEDLIYYDLTEEGTFFIDKNNTNELELYDQGNQNDPGAEIGSDDIKTILTGKWKWEDSETEMIFVVRQNGKYNFIADGSETSDGDWEYTVVEEEGEKYDVLLTSFVDEDGKQNQYAYLINYFDDESLQLILFSVVQNDQEIDIDNMSESDLVVMLYKME